MVNILKNRKINKNPFVKYLKEFFKTENTSTLKELSGMEGIIEHYLGNGRTVIFNNGSLMLVNDNYSSLGYFEVPIEDLTYNSGNIYFIIQAENIEVKFIKMFFTSIPQVYNIINKFDSVKEESELRSIFVNMDNLGLLKTELV